MKKVVFIILITFIALLGGCSNNANKSGLSNIKFEYFYRGFVTLKEGTVNSYPQSTLVIQTNEDWHDFMDKYVPGIPYYVPVDYSKESLVFSVAFAAKPTYTSGVDIKTFTINGDELTPEYISGSIGESNGIYAQNFYGIEHCFVNIVKVNKENIPKNIKNIYHKGDVITDNKNASQAMNNNPTKSSAVRGEGISKFGSLIVVPNGEEEVGTLGADSAYGKASDFTFNADYKIVFKDFSNNEKVIGTIDKQNIPVIIQPKNNKIEMNKLQVGDNEIFIFIPQYASSNNVPLYAFLVDKNGEASQVKFQFDSNSAVIGSSSILSTTSSKFELPSVESGMIIIKSLMNLTSGSPDLKLYKQTFKLNKDVLILTLMTLLN